MVIKFNLILQNNYWNFFCINNSSYSTGNDITLAGSSNTLTYNPLFHFFQSGNLSINYGSITTQGIINNLTLTNNGTATFNSQSVFYGISTYYARIGFINVDNPIQIDNGKNIFFLSSYYSNTINDSNY